MITLEYALFAPHKKIAMQSDENCILFPLDSITKEDCSLSEKTACQPSTSLQILLTTCRWVSLALPPVLNLKSSGFPIV